MLNQTVFADLQPIQTGEHGYTANNPAVIADPDKLVVDRAVRQLLTALQSVKLDIGEDADGVVLNLGYLPQGGGQEGLIRVAKATGTLQFFDRTDATWKDFGSGGGSAWPTPDGYEATDVDNHLNDTRILHQSYGVQAIDNQPAVTLTAAQCLNHRVIEVQGSSCDLTLPGSALPDGARISIFAMGGVTVRIIPSDAMTIILGGTGYASIENTSPLNGDGITLRNHYAYGHWVLESMIGSWGGVV
jgi:hypothetical protein